MKTTFAFTLFLIISVSISAQNYYSFIEQGKTWADITVFDNTISPIEIWTDGYKFEGDTVFQGKIYHSLYNCHKDSTMTNWIPSGYKYYREDSNKVYQKDLWFDDVILYDFNLHAGDSILINTFYGYAHVSYVDSTMVCGSYRKTIHFVYPPDIWIEGIGSLYNTFEPLVYHFLLDGYTQLLCVYDSTCQLYQNPAYSSCYVDTTILSLEQTARIRHCILISPNPVETTCEISIIGLTERISEMQLFDSRGILLRKEPVFENSCRFNRKNIPSGIYFLRIIGNRTILNEKIIVN
jgi:hypothetical protein